MNPQINAIGLQVSTMAPLPVSGIVFSMTTPGEATAKAATDANGTIGSDISGSTWSALATGPAVGQYIIEITTSDNPSLVTNGVLNLDKIKNVALVVGYTFTPRI
jgi:hypothetical protein